MAINPSGVIAVAILAMLAVGSSAATASAAPSVPPQPPARPGPAAPPPTPAPGAGAPASALATARAATAALPHSPRLLRALAGPVSPASRGARASGLTVPGIDVAAFQHPNGARINWAAVAAAGYKFAAVKATEGDYYVNPWARTDLAAAKAAGLYITAYHFAIPNVTGGAAQARFAVLNAGYATGGHMLPLMLDIEYDPYVNSDHTNECYGLSHAKMRAWIAAFVSTIRSLTGQLPIIYTTADWWDTCTGRSTAFGADPMWVAAYGFASPPLPAGWATWTFWQYTSSGTVPGVDSAGNTDLSVFNTNLVGLVDPGNQRTRAGATVSLRLRSLGALGREPLSYRPTGLPPGLAITGSGTIAGLVRGPAKTYRVTIAARNPAGAVGSVSFTWQVSALSPAGFWSGTDSTTVAIGGHVPYRAPVIGGAYGGYIGMTGNWANLAGCHKIVTWSAANSAQANADHAARLGIGTGAYWFMGGPGVDPRYNGTQAEAYAWGERQAAQTLSKISRVHVTYPVVFMDIEFPGKAADYTPAPDNGWNTVYTSPCSGRVRVNYIPTAVDRAELNGYAAYLTTRSGYKAGVYSAPGIWAAIFGTGFDASIPNTYEWTYESFTSSLARHPSGWCLAGTSTCAQFFGGQTGASKYALMWQWSGGGGSRNGHGDFDQIDASRTP